MLGIFNVLKQIKAVVDQATSLWDEAHDGKGKEGWIVFFEARSFWLAVVSVLFATLSVAGVVPPIPVDVAIEGVNQFISAALAIWAVIERLRGNKTVVWSSGQANQAIKQAQTSGKK